MRVLVVGRWPDARRRRTGFPELRTEATVEALRQAGMQLRIAGLVPPGSEEEASPGAVAVPEEGPGWLEAVAQVGRDCEVVVAAGPHNATRAAVLVAGERPVWADVPGDPFAEVQAVAAAEGAPRPVRQAAATAALLPALVRADGFGAVSQRQRLLLLGQLGLVGRLASPDALDPDSLDPVAVVPVAWHLGLAPARPRTRPPGQPLTLLLSGAFNAWLDVDGLVRGLEPALGDSVERILVTGGPAAGHHDAAWERFAAWADRQGERVELLGFLPAEQLPAAAARAHLGISLDRPGLEPETGSRTRVLFYLHQGLQVMSSTRTELCAELAEAGLLHAISGPGTMPARLAELRDRGSDGRQVAKAQQVLAERYAPHRAHAAVVRFARAPWRLPAVEHPMAELAAAHAALLDERRRLHATPTWRALSKLHGLVRKARGS